jgi:hypothetical protein
LIGLAVSVFVALLLTRSGKLWLCAASIALVIVSLLQSGAIADMDNAAISRLTNPADEGVLASNLGRQERLSEEIEGIKQNPLVGQGFGQALDAHNLILQLWGASGIAGVIGLAHLIAIFVVCPSVQIAKDPLNHHDLLIGLVSGFAGFLVADFFQNALWERYFWIYPSLLTAYIVLTVQSNVHFAGQRRDILRSRSTSPTRATWDFRKAAN